MGEFQINGILDETFNTISIKGKNYNIKNLSKATRNKLYKFLKIFDNNQDGYLSVKEQGQIDEKKLTECIQNLPLEQAKNLAKFFIKPKLDKDQLDIAFQRWNQIWPELLPEERIEVLSQLTSEQVKKVNIVILSEVRREVDENINSHNYRAFEKFGSSLNLVPEIGMENNPENKIRLIGKEYSSLMEDRLSGSYDKVKTTMERRIIGTNYVKTIANGGGTCGELSWALCDTINGAFSSQCYPANFIKGQGNTVNAAVIQAEGIPTVNHQAALITINGRKVVCDPAWYIINNNKFVGFEKSKEFMMPLKTEGNKEGWIDLWLRNSYWGSTMERFYIEDGKCRKLIYTKSIFPPLLP